MMDIRVQESTASLTTLNPKEHGEDYMFRMAGDNQVLGLHDYMFRSGDNKSKQKHK